MELEEFNIKSKWLMRGGIMIACAIPLIITFFVLWGTGTITPFIQRFDVDSQGRIYVGIDDNIVVYQDKKEINRFPFPKGENTFIITADDVIYVQDGLNAFAMDLSGNVTEYMEDADIKFPSTTPSVPSLLGMKKQNGDVYRFVDLLGYTRIVKNNTEVVFAISELTCAAKLLGIFCILGFAGTHVYLIIACGYEIHLLHKKNRGKPDR